MKMRFLTLSCIASLAIVSCEKAPVLCEFKVSNRSELDARHTTLSNASGREVTFGIMIPDAYAVCLDSMPIQLDEVYTFSCETDEGIKRHTFVLDEARFGKNPHRIFMTILEDGSVEAKP